MGLSGIQIFKMTPKKNCKECGCPTCMAFSMKVAQGAMDISQCPHMSEDALAQLSEATAPPMKTVKNLCKQNKICSIFMLMYGRRRNRCKAGRNSESGL